MIPPQSFRQMAGNPGPVLATRQPPESHQNNPSRSLMSASSASFRKTGSMAGRAAALALAATLALSQAVPAQAGFIGDLLFAPTYDEDYVPSTYGSRADCRNPSAGPWRGIVGGRKSVDLRTIQFSREGCFQSEAECRAFLNHISGYLTLVFTAQCSRR